jgi:hypothetical protein
MLQGNPFETQLEVNERTYTIRQEMALGRGVSLPGIRARIETWREAVELGFDLRSLEVPSLNAFKSAWWLPAGIAIAFLLSVFISQ